jgi:Flp pilus assembly protein TadG
MWPVLLSRIALFRRDDRGLQLVELAIVLPILIVLLAAVAEFGRYFQEYTTLAKGSRVAARYLATAPTCSADDLNAKRLVVYGNTAGTGSPIVNGLSVNNVNIVRRNAAGDVTTGFPTTVTVEIINYQHTSIFDLGGLTRSTSASLNIAVKPSVTMRYLLTQPIPC